MKTTKPKSKKMSAYDAAIRLLARREHSCLELQRKLTQRAYSESEITTALEQLVAEKLQSDERFAEMYTRHRMEAGYGPIRIRLELAERGVADHLIEEALAELEVDWQAQAELVRQKKFGAPMPNDFPDKAKQLRFLQYRGFQV